jgi:predicted transcriptional regulator
MGRFAYRSDSWRRVSRAGATRWPGVGYNESYRAQEHSVNDDRTRPRSGPEQLLGDLEAAIMRLIWQQGEMSVRDVWSALQPERPLAYTTVMTVMSRLVPKGLLAARKQGQAYFYRPTMSPDAFVAHRAQAAVQRVVDDFGDLALAQFVRELEEVDPDRLRRLRELADRRAAAEDGDAA